MCVCIENYIINGFDYILPQSPLQIEIRDAIANLLSLENKTKFVSFSLRDFYFVFCTFLSFFFFSLDTDKEVESTNQNVSKEKRNEQDPEKKNFTFFLILFFFFFLSMNDENKRNISLPKHSEILSK
ncbi:hypothetical protein OUZ56_028330 [Daphnia magna]|uniref:Uncharacterized protein n=1 Tax=Daphnia magna TaxID=35525 RepID=A0ABR0B3J5_9CRUS|nr:hypothetical protein OUZ56_028330 [Daphnia magna]